MIAPRLSGREETASGTARSADIRQPTPLPAPQHDAGVAAMYALICLSAALLAYDYQARFRGPEPRRLPVGAVVVRLVSFLGACHVSMRRGG